MLRRLLSALLAFVTAGFVVDLFLRWTEGRGGEFSFGETTGVDIVPGFLCLPGGLALFFWELLGGVGVRRSARSDSLVSFLLAATTGVTAITAVVHLKWGSPYPYGHDLAYGALAAIPLAVLLLAGAVAHLALHVLETRAVQPA
jgi:hypothetical protein